MAKDNRIIIGAVRLPSPINERRQSIGSPQEFRTGEEDELAEAATPEQIAYLKKQGVLTGDWGNSPVGEDESEADTGNSSSPKLTAKVSELLDAAGVIADETLCYQSDDELKAHGLNTAQIKNVRSVFGEFVPATS